jgi:hypothetical protein
MSGYFGFSSAPAPLAPPALFPRHRIRATHFAENIA